MPLPADLRAAPSLVLAAAAEDLPVSAKGATSPWVYEPKWDGFRVAAVVTGGRARVWSRHGKDLTQAFPDLAAALVAQVPQDSVLDGEAVVWAQGALSFSHLQQRMGASARRAADLARQAPASLLLFDALVVGGEDLRAQPWAQRRAALEATADWTPPLQLSPTTRATGEAMDWFDTMHVAGVEGLMAKRDDQPYRGGRRLWTKVKRRETTEVVVGAVTGTVRRPTSFVAGRFDGKTLRIVGRSQVLKAPHQRELAQVLTEAADHPWPRRLRGRFGTDDVNITPVEPLVVVEVSADAARDNGVFRHSLRVVRVRPDLQPRDVDPF